APVIATAAVLVVFAHGFQPFGPDEKLAQVATSGIWIAAGLIAWQRRPGNRVGPLMTAVGFCDVAQQLYWHAALPFTLATLTADFFFAGALPAPVPRVPQRPPRYAFRALVRGVRVPSRPVVRDRRPDVLGRPDARLPGLP